METTCHNCKSKDIFYDGEVYQCMHCSYMWIPEISPEEYKRKLQEERKQKDKTIIQEYPKENPEI